MSTYVSPPHNWGKRDIPGSLKNKHPFAEGPGRGLASGEWQWRGGLGARGAERGSEMGKDGQYVQTASYKINKSWGCDYS